MKLEHHGAEPESVQTCVIFDPATGRIVHTHHVVTLPGATSASPEEVEQRAWQRASAAGHDPSALRAIHVDSEQLNRSASYRVDVTTLKLIAIERPLASLSAAPPRPKKAAARKPAAKAAKPKAAAKGVPAKGKPAAKAVKPKAAPKAKPAKGKPAPKGGKKKRR
jgi:hypothetical protein